MVLPPSVTAEPVQLVQLNATILAEAYNLYYLSRYDFATCQGTFLHDGRASHAP